jgi:geranylgeranylglycerol-phosphate geranylgeranyltransferase
VVAITIGGTILTVAYSTTLKRYGFAGNVVVALLTAMALLLGGAIQNQLKIAVWPALVAFLMNVGREITKGIDDLAGDMESKVKTLAVVLGPKPASWVSVIFMICAIGVAVVPYVLLYFSIYYFIILIFIAILVAYVIISLLKRPTPENAHRLKTLQKIAMFLGLLAFLIGAIPVQ